MTRKIDPWLGTGSINVFGYPFAGKDTQGQFLAELLNAPLIGGGDILRNSTIPPHIKAVMDRGELIPTEDYLNIVLPYLSQEQFRNKPLVLSSVGRWVGEEEGVIRATSDAGHPIKAVVYLKLEERDVWRRWQSLQDSMHLHRGERYDDAAEALETRLEEFNIKTKPVIEFYRSLGLVIEIDSHAPIEAVRKQLLELLEAKALSNY